MISTTYGEGGFDPTKPNNNIIEQVELPDPPAEPVDPARASAMAKLAKLGLTAAEIEAMLP